MAEKVTRTIYINGKEVEYTLKSVNSQLTRLRNELKGAEIDSQEFVDKLSEIKKVEAIYQRHAAALKPIKSGMSELTSTVAGFASAAGLAFSVGSLISFGREVLTVANNYEQTRISFEAMLQSKEKADKLQADLFELVAKSPFEMEQAQEATKKLLAFGFSAAEVIPTLKSLGDIAAGVGQEKLPQIILAFGQVRAKTRLMGDELKQFTEAGIPLIEELAKVFKKPQGEIQKMVSEGKVGFADVQKALTNLTSEGGRFANLMEKQSASLQGVFSTFSDTFKQSVLLPIGSALSDQIKPLLSDLTTTIEGLFPATNKASEGVFKMQAAFNVEMDTLKRANLTHDARKELLQKINKEYGSYLPSLLTEKTSITEIAKAQEFANAAFTKKITLMAAEEEFVRIQKELFKVKREELDLQENLTVSQNSLNDATDDYAKAAATLVSGERQGALNQNLEQQKKIQAEYQKALETAKKLGVEMDKVAAPQKQMPLLNPEEAEKRSKEITETLKRFAEQVKGFQADLSQNEAEGYERDILKLKEKYQKQFDALKEFRAKFPEAAAKAHAIETQMTQLQAENIQAIIQNHLKTLADEIDQHDKEAALRLQSKEDQEVAAINKKYEKQIILATKLENDTKNATESQRQQAHTERLQLESTREQEIVNMKAKIRYEQEAKDAEATNQFWALMKQQRDNLQAFLDEKPVKIGLNEDNLAEVLQNIDETAKAERAAVNKNAELLIKDAGDAAKDILKINEKRGELLEAITAKTNANIEKAEKTHFEKTLADQKRNNDLRLQLLQDIGNGFVALGDLIAGENVKNSGIQKAAALFQIAVDTATALSSVVTKTTAMTGATPLLNALRIAGGIAVVLTNMAKARSILNAAPTVKQKFEGGYTAVRGQTDGKTYNSRYIGQPSTGMLNYNSPVLMNTSTGPVLANEKGNEFFVSNAALRNPVVFRYTQIIDNIVNGRKQFVDGGYNSPPRPEGELSSGENAHSGGWGGVAAAIERNTAVLSQLVSVLNGGVTATFKDDFQFVADLQKKQNRLLQIDPNYKTRTY